MIRGTINGIYLVLIDVQRSAIRHRLLKARHLCSPNIGHALLSSPSGRGLSRGHATLARSLRESRTAALVGRLAAS